MAEIKKMVSELYKRPFISEPVIETVISTVEVPNTWEDSANVQVKETREEKKRKKREAKEANKKARIESIWDEGDHETLVVRWLLELEDRGLRLLLLRD